MPCNVSHLSFLVVDTPPLAAPPHSLALCFCECKAMGAAQQGFTAAMTPHLCSPSLFAFANCSPNQGCQRRRRIDAPA